MAIKDRLEKELKLAQESAEKIKEMAGTDRFEDAFVRIVKGAKS